MITPGQVREWQGDVSSSVEREADIWEARLDKEIGKAAREPGRTSASLIVPCIAWVRFGGVLTARAMGAGWKTGVTQGRPGDDEYCFTVYFLEAE